MTATLRRLGMVALMLLASAAALSPLRAQEATSHLLVATVDNYLPCGVVSPKASASPTR